VRWFQRHGTPEASRPEKIIVGLGNPGPRYAASRHNVGFHVLDRLAQKHRLEFKRKRFNAHLAEGEIDARGVLLVKPQTFMNLSGEAVGKVLNANRVPFSDIIVVYDDLDLPLGKLRLRARGSAGGHHGMESIIAHIHSSEFARLRVGIGRPASREDVNHVLGRFNDDETETIEATYERAVEALEIWLDQGIEKAMNLFNRDE
jgi:PTH1 family peptidyl-tRNA hydrolase